MKESTKAVKNFRKSMNGRVYDNDGSFIEGWEACKKSVFKILTKNLSSVNSTWDDVTDSINEIKEL